MAQKTTSRHTDWEQSIQRIYILLTTVILSVSLTACMTALTYSLYSGISFVLAQWVADLSALLHVAVVVMLSRLTVQAALVCKCLQSNSKRTAESKQLWKSIWSLMIATMFMLPLTIGAFALPISLSVVMRVPETGTLFAFLIVALLMQRINIQRACRQLTKEIPAAQQAAQRTLVV
ncbi:hypothetical protein ISN34_04060 [Xanthomonas translucens pv. translucens]|nr:hypothetical protein [Xanthomonas translucens]QSQ31186.1 hypothetical protein ISN30_04835 [Xanthomonas translucens pv. translucens]QSQ33002.1 hypothetical protein ISN31_14075 [Xanthomonas translucens pv. translucens]QSQ46079.1 hypothetical protein ISN34_04060 [Xanthomonas translucens pv. translucens]